MSLSSSASVKKCGRGRQWSPAVDAGFGKALLTIIDTHVTTVVSCAILFLFGSGPVKGFAVTLVIGLVANVFTAVFVSRFIFDWELSRPKPVTGAQYLREYPQQSRFFERDIKEHL